MKNIYIYVCKYIFYSYSQYPSIFILEINNKQEEWKTHHYKFLLKLIRISIDI